MLGRISSSHYFGEKKHVQTMTSTNHYLHIVKHFQKTNA